jgi:hypothetical protein
MAFSLYRVIKMDTQIVPALEENKPIQETHLEMDFFERHTEEIFGFIELCHIIVDEQKKRYRERICNYEYVKVPFPTEYVKEHFPIIDQFLPKTYCEMECCLLLIIKHYLHLWSKYINNNTPNVRLKTRLIHVFEHVIMTIPFDIEYGHQFCGCDDLQRAENEDMILIIREYHPEEYLEQYGYVYFNKSREELREHFSSWRHNMIDMRASVSADILHFKRTLHKSYLKAFFPLASTVGQDSAKNVLAFL